MSREGKDDRIVYGYRTPEANCEPKDMMEKESDQKASTASWSGSSSDTDYTAYQSSNSSQFYGGKSGSSSSLSGGEESNSDSSDSCVIL